MKLFFIHPKTISDIIRIFATDNIKNSPFYVFCIRVNTILRVRISNPLRCLRY